MAKQQRDYPLEVAGIAWRNLKKGDTISAEKIDEMWDLLYGATRKKDDRYVSVSIKEWLDKALRSIGNEMVLKESNGQLVILTDEQAVGYLDGQANQGLRKHKNNTRRMFTAIDTSNLTQHQSDELQSKQAKHALISAAAEGARKQAITLQRRGSKLPQLKPPSDD